MKKLIAILFCFMFTLSLIAEDKKKVQLKFSITEKQYINFYDFEITFIEKECSSLMVDFLNQSFGFFEFTVEEDTNVLYIDLIDHEQNSSSSSSLKEVGFKLYVKPIEPIGIAFILIMVYWV